MTHGPAASARAPARLLRSVTLAAAAWLLLCTGVPRSGMALEPQPGSSDPFIGLRREMVDVQIRKRGVSHKGVLRAMEEVPRHLFVPESVRDRAYVDSPLGIGDGQTISQPYIVALMTELLDLDGDEKVLEIGTGSGYQAAVASRLAKEIYSIEIRDSLAQRATKTLEELGYDNVVVRTGDGYQGWPEEAPFDAIIVTAAPPEIPQTLIDQLKVGGRMVVPVGRYFQDLVEITKEKDSIRERRVAPVLFVPMVSDPD